MLTVFEVMEVLLAIYGGGQAQAGGRERVGRVGCVTEDGALVHEDADVCVAGGVALQKSLSRGDAGLKSKRTKLWF